jgi:hypothetical protein
MAVTFVSSAVPSGNPTTSLTITIPTVSVDDLLILAVTNGGATTAPTVSDNDTGGNAWAQKSSAAAKGRLYWKRATGSTSAKTITASGFTNSCSGVLFVLRGAIATGDPFDFFVPEENISGNEVSAGGTPSVNGCYVGLSVHNGASNGDVNVTSPATTSPGALTDFAEKLSTGGVDCACAMAGRAQATATVTGNFTWAQTDLATTSHAFAIKPVAAVAYGPPGGVTAGALPITGSSVTMRYGKTAGTHVAASLPISGATVAPIFAKSIAVTPAALPIAGATVEPVYDPGQTDYEIEVTPAALPIAGAAVSTVFNKTLAVEAASLPIAGASVAPVLAHSVEVTPASLPIDGATLDLVFNKTIAVTPAALPIQGAAVDTVFVGSTAYEIEITPASLPIEGAGVTPLYEAGPGEETTGGASYIPGLVEGYRARKERRRKAEERLWETARETYRQLHGIAREAPEAIPEAIQEEVKELVAPAVKARAAKRAQATLPAPSTINWNVLTVHIASIERLTVILAELEAARFEDEEDDEDFLFMAA